MLYEVITFAVQVGAFGVRANAERLQNEMISRYGAATISTGVVDGQTFHRVWVGRYTSLEAAEQAKVDLNGGFVVALEK